MMADKQTICFNVVARSSLVSLVEQRSPDNTKNRSDKELFRLRVRCSALDDKDSRTRAT